MDCCSNITSQGLDDLVQCRDILAFQVNEEFILVFVETGRSGLNVGQVDTFFLWEREILVPQFLGKGIWHKDWINTCVSQQTILYHPNNSKAATGLEDFHNRERNRQEEWEICGIHPCADTITKNMHYWNLRERWKPDTGCKQASYCKWKLESLKYNESLSVLTKTFPQDQPRKKAFHL